MSSLEGCTRHPGEIIQEYCEACNELLCTQCLRAGHPTEHKTLSYSDHLHDRKREAFKLSRRIENIKHEINDLQKLFQEKREKFFMGLQKSAEKIKSLQEVHRVMSDWEVRNTSMMDRKNSMQLQTLEEARRKGSKTVQIERPKILIRIKARANLHKIVKELTPNLVLSISGVSAFSRHSQSFAHDLLPPFLRSPLQQRKTVMDDGEFEYDYVASSVSSCSDGSSGKSFSVAEHQSPRPVPIPRKPRTRVPRPVSQPVYHSSQKFKGKGKGFDIYDSIATDDDDSDNKEEDLHDNTVTSRPKEKRKNRPIVPSRDDTPEAGDDEYVYYSSPAPYEKPISEIEETYDATCQPVRQPSNEYDEVSPAKSTTEDAYTYIDSGEIIPQLSPPPLPPRREIKAITNESEIYETLPEEPIYYNAVSDPKQINLKPANIILNGLAAANPSESVMLHDVCTGPLGSMIFTDQESSSVRILMTVDQKPHKSTKAMRCRLQAVAYDQKNTRIIVASEKGLQQLEFDETKPNKSKNLKLFSKDNYCMSITSTKPIRGEPALIYAVTKKDGETFIACFKQNGQFLMKLEVGGIPCCIAHKEGYLVVATAQDKNLHKINTNGFPLWNQDVDARKKGVLFVPFRVVILPSHNIAVSEKEQHCISVFSKEGQHILRFGQFGNEPGMFNQPTGIAIRLEKELVVVDSGNKKIQIFALDELAKQFEVAVVEKETAEKEDSDDTIEL